MHLEAAAKSTRQTAGYALEEYAIEWIAHMSWPYSGLRRHRNCLIPLNSFRAGGNRRALLIAVDQTADKAQH